MNGVHSPMHLGKLLSYLPAPYPTLSPREANSRRPPAHQAQPALLPCLPETTMFQLHPSPHQFGGPGLATGGIQPSLQSHQLRDGRGEHHELLIAVEEQLESSQV